MNSPTFNMQFLPIDFRLLDDPRAAKFLCSRAWYVYMTLRRYIWRRDDHSNRTVRRLRGDGLLVAPVSRQLLADKAGIVDLKQISEYIGALQRQKLIEVVPTGRMNVYVLGTCEDKSRLKDGSHIVESYYLDQVYGVDNRPQITAEEGPPKGRGGKSPSPDEGKSPPSGQGKEPSSGGGKRPTQNRERKKRTEQQRALSLLKRLPLSESQRRSFAARFSVQRIEEVIEKFHGLSSPIRNPSGWLCDAFEKEWEFHDSTAAAKERIRSLRRCERAREAKAKQEETRQAVLRKTVDAWVTKYPDRFKSLVDGCKREQGPFVRQSKVVSESVAVAAARTKVAEDLGLKADKAA